jgi:putative transposase
MKAFCFRLYPSKAQRKLLEETRETCRCFYNDCLAERKEAYQQDGTTLGKFEQLRRVKERKATDPDAAKVHSHILQVVVTDLDKAFQNFFRRVEAGETPGYPRFKSWDRFDSFGLKEYGNGFRIDGRRLKISGIGRISVRWHRPIEGTIKTVRVVKPADGWYACFACETETAAPLAPTGQRVGIDVGVASLLTTSEGEKVAHPAFYRQGQKKLRRLQRAVARKQKGGSNRRKAVARLRRHHQRVANQRKDFLNKVAHRLVQENDLIALEDLRITNMVRNRHLSKSILDAGWRYFADRLACKAAEAGRQVVFVDPRNTSRTCSQCGASIEHLTLSVRHVSCACGLSMDRDENAARNHLSRAGQVRWTPSTPLGVLVQEATRLQPL